MAHDPQPDLDGKRRVHAVAGLVLLLIVVGFLVIFIATNWRRDSQTDGRGLLGSEVNAFPEVATYTSAKMSRRPDNHSGGGSSPLRS